MTNQSAKQNSASISRKITFAIAVIVAKTAIISTSIWFLLQFALTKINWSLMETWLMWHPGVLFFACVPLLAVPFMVLFGLLGLAFAAEQGR